jgi:hypothetical protein
MLTQQDLDQIAAAVDARLSAHAAKTAELLAAHTLATAEALAAKLATEHTICRLGLESEDVSNIRLFLSIVRIMGRTTVVGVVGAGVAAFVTVVVLGVRHWFGPDSPMPTP